MHDQRTCLFRRASRSGLALLLATLSALVGPAIRTAEGAQKVVAIGDVHGAYGPLVEILRTSGLVDQNLRWSGGDTILVQTGDLVERGTEVRKVLDLLMALEEQAQEAGGRVVVLLGNHEVINLLAYLDYKSTPPDVYRKIFVGFMDDESEERREKALKQWKKWRARFPHCGRQSKAGWEETHPPGFIEYFEAMAPSGAYGRWLRSLATVTKIGTTMFAHAGPSPWVVEQGFDSPYTLSRAVTREVEAFDEAREYLLEKGIILPFFTLSEIHCAVTEELVRTTNAGRPAKYFIPLTKKERERLAEIREELPNVESSLTLRSEGPLWYRGYSKLQGPAGRSVVDEVLGAFGASDLVISHSTEKGEIKRRFDRVYLIDTGMVYGGPRGGRPAALQIEAGRFSAVYLDERTLLAERPASPEPQPATLERLAETRRWLTVSGDALPLGSDAEVEEFLRSARIVSNQPLTPRDPEVRELLLEQYGMRARAVFRRIDETEQLRRLSTGKPVRFFTDSYRSEIAAYRLGRMLGIVEVHPTVERTIEGVAGSVQLWHEEVMSERERVDRDLHPPDRLAWRQQIDDMRIFDNLINNFDRSRGSILIDPQWRIWLVDHTRSFGAEPELPDPDYVERCSRQLWKSMQDLERKSVAVALGDVLNKWEIDALFARRAALLDLIRERVAASGEDGVLFKGARGVTETR